jgi:hypothetical protein
MVIRMNGANPDDPDDDICILEATSNSGVHLKLFSNMVKYIGNFYKKIAFRHLEMERTDDQMETLNKFLDEAIGRKYDLK